MLPIIPLYRVTINDSPITTCAPVPRPIAEEVAELLQRRDKRRTYDVAFARNGRADDDLIGAYADWLVDVFGRRAAVPSFAAVVAALWSSPVTR